jgi:hypothetical protein
MRQYKGQEYKLKIGTFYGGEHFYLQIPPRGMGHMEIIGKSGVGKSALAKHICVLTSKVRKVCILDYNGEWIRHVTQYSDNPRCPYKQKLTNYKELNNIGLKISEIIRNINALVSLGFSSDGISYIQKLAIEGFGYYRDNVDKFAEMIMDLPTTQSEDLQKYYEKYHIRLPMQLNYMTKLSLVNHFDFVREWFFDPTKENDLNYYDFKQEFKENDHLILNFYLREQPTTKERAMALAGYVLNELRSIQDETHASYFLEEANQLLPPIDDSHGDYMIPSSVLEIREMLTMDRKRLGQMVLLTQTEKQIYKGAIDHFHIIIGGRDAILLEKYDLKTWIKEQNLKWNWAINFRELFYWDAQGNKLIFIPDIPCCAC